MENVKPCPFCGRKVELQNSGITAHHPYYEKSKIFCPLNGFTCDLDLWEHRASQPEKGENSIKDGIALQLLDIADCKECSDREKIASVRTYARYGLLSSPAPLAMKDKCLSCQWFKESGEPLACLTCENNSNFKVQQKEASDGR